MTDAVSAKGDFWTEASAARRYREARPYFHPVVMRLVRDRIGMKPGEKFRRGIDVGCGTGQSTVALLELAETVTGVDSSEQMLAHAERRDGVKYLPGTAEQLPVSDSSADIVTASLATHWFDLPAFLSEATRVLRPGGWLVTYSNGFRGQMIGNEAFHDWSEHVYLSRYPTPPRPHYDPPEDAFAASRFELVADGHGTSAHPSTGSGWHLPTSHPEPVEGWRPEPYANEITFSPRQLVAYLMTQSNVIAKVEQGAESAADVKTWLDEQIQRFFTHSEENFLFGGSITFARLATKN